jgi:hypothetical protein
MVGLNQAAILRRRIGSGSSFGDPKTLSPAGATVALPDLRRHPLQVFADGLMFAPPPSALYTAIRWVEASASEQASSISAT